MFGACAREPEAGQAARRRLLFKTRREGRRAPARQPAGRPFFKGLATLHTHLDLQLEVNPVGEWQEEGLRPSAPGRPLDQLLAGLPLLQRLSLTSATPCPVPAAAGPGTALQALARLQASAPGLRVWLAVALIDPE